ncbi:uncharacterized protein BX663DRAFT_485634 [Cokeromyces recurvatus]|uniref:uncharacterized protein n=1 Tax=Cokeromyces recurvatus TaxID=90255 RepID=UPI002220635D|nr:uncharacterized protein BX663DRAFT_485634 [Cokeromyces recurvatus]KAI7903482.1 hypothetical protein BX663DRAFT_485634 [Cokeromyces recurvatus]
MERALTYKKKWIPEEDELLAKYIKLYGYGNWKKISEQFKTRTQNQCKGRARTNPKLRKLAASKKENEKYETKDKLPLSKDFNTITNHLEQSSFETAVDQKEEEEEGVVVNKEKLHKNNLTIQRKNTQIEQKKEVFIINKEDINTKQEPEYEFDETKITNDERASNVEWFEGKPSKTPERYMRIRNHIINNWKISRPKYLSKTAGRRNLENCGDVNAVGRIHSYLQCRNIINVDCVEPFPRKKRVRARNKSVRILEHYSKRRTTLSKHDWVHLNHDICKQQEDTMIASNNKDERRGIREKTVLKEHYDVFYHDSDNDPFRLIPLNQYSKHMNAPFIVNISSNVLLVIDFHSHLAYTEIIGLLAGAVIRKENGAIHVQVEYIFPCRSTSASMQSEMDPISEMEAYELFKKKGLKVVGWYHSHPTFEPEPSIRDIANQASYQFLFRDDTLGLEPFIGIIITPYNYMNASFESQIKVMHISDQWNYNNDYRK